MVRAPDLLAVLLREAAAVAVAGVLAGVAYGATAGIVLAIAAVACYLPARRAARLDVAAVLRAE